MSSYLRRRRLLAVAGAGAAISIAGCSDAFGSVGSNDESNTVSAVLSPDRDEVTELQERGMAGEIDEEEFREEVEALMEETLAEVEDLDSVTVEESELEFGLVRLAGESDAIIEALNEGHLGALYAGGDYEEIVEAQERQRRQREQQAEIDPEDLEAGDGGEEDGEDGDSNESDDE